MEIAAGKSGRAARIAAIATRTLVASAGGYALAVASVFFFARILPLSRAEATVSAALIALLIMPTAAIWAVAARSAPRAAIGLIALVAALGGIAWIVGPHA